MEQSRKLTWRGGGHGDGSLGAYENGHEHACINRICMDMGGIWACAYSLINHNVKYI